MSIINLEKRITSNMQEYDENKKSSKSLIYVSEAIQHDYCSGETLILTVGNSYLKNSQQINIKDKGIKVKPGESILIQTKQKIATPLNVVGTIYGIGCNIFNNGFISAGKIDQGFNDYLKIGFYNGGKRAITFKKGDILACAIFYETEETMPAAKEEKDYDRIPNYDTSFIDVAKQFITTHWISIISLIIAAVALINDIIK